MLGACLRDVAATARMAETLSLVASKGGLEVLNFRLVIGGG